MCNKYEVTNRNMHLTDVGLSSDFIAGFCGETEEDHQMSLQLMRLIKYNFAFCFPYSLRKVSQMCGKLSLLLSERAAKLCKV